MSTTASVPRHKTAIRRGDLSYPVKCALRDELITAASSLLDYGCGHGKDVELLAAKGVLCSGWDPTFRPGEPKPADIVNLGYILNVIEDPQERSASLRKAWELAGQVLVVSAQVEVAGRGREYIEFGDGCLSRRGTFQKFYKQGELKEYLEAVLDTEPIPASLGVFYIFKDEALRQQFLANRFRHRGGVPRKRMGELQFEEHRTLLAPLIDAATTLGRLPAEDECPGAEQIIARLGSLKRAFALIRRATGGGEWDTLRRQRTDDYLVYLALARFRSRPPISKLPARLQRDIRAFFGSYTKACRSADDLLFRAGKADAIDAACRSSPIGKLLPNALYVHRRALGLLSALLRVLAGTERVLNELPRQLQAAQKRLERHVRRLREVEKVLEKIPADDVLQPLLERIRELHRELGTVESEVERHEVAVKGVELHQEESVRRERKVLEQLQEAEQLRDRAALAIKVQTALEDYARALTAAKIDELRDGVVRCFGQLWRKGDLVRRIAIDPATFAVTLFDRHDRVVPKKQLSAGEKQIYAISLLWGLAQASGRPLPMVIDTPLGRLDSEHRTHLIERYFPHASHQVVIFSTDTEIDRVYFRELTASISHAYHLRYDAAEAKCVIEKGYFWSSEGAEVGHAG
jgi:DNA phosphorothioation-associated putative methyltransferase